MLTYPLEEEIKEEEGTETYNKTFRKTSSTTQT
jgi:hypothetical protein